MPRQESTPDRILGEVAVLLGKTRFEVKWALVATSVFATMAVVRKLLDTLAEQELNHPSGSLRR